MALAKAEAMLAPQNQYPAPRRSLVSRRIPLPRCRILIAVTGHGKQATTRRANPLVQIAATPNDRALVEDRLTPRSETAMSPQAISRAGLASQIRFAGCNINSPNHPIISTSPETMQPLEGECPQNAVNGKQTK